MTCVVALGGLALVACDNTPDNPDAFVAPRDAYVPPPEDTGPMPDTGPTDGGGTPDAGPPRPLVRLAHFMPGVPNIHVCLFLLAGGVERGGGPPVTVVRPAGIPYPGISGYITFPADPTLEYRVKVYPATAIADPSSATACGTATGEPLIQQDVPAGTLGFSSSYTVSFMGLPDGTAGTPQAPHVVIIADDTTAPAAGMVRVRLVHAIPNIPVPAVDVCHDPDGPGGAMPPVEMFDNVAYEDAADYMERMPVTSGTITVHAHNDAPIPDCLMMAPPAGTLILGPVPVPFPIPPDPNPGMFDETDPLRATFAAGEIDTAFAIGDARMSAMAIPCTMASDCAAAGPAGTICNPITMRCAHPLGPTVVPWQDNYVAP